MPQFGLAVMDRWSIAALLPLVQKAAIAASHLS
jgi:hypothetical protein